MTRRLRGDEGMALMAAILVLSILMTLGIGVLAFANNQQHDARIERTRESSFDQAEAVLNAQVFQLARNWPTAAAPATGLCTPSTAGPTTTCPDTNSLNQTFTTADYTAPSGCALPLWKTQVQDDNAAQGGTQYYNASALAGSPPYDANGNNSVWIRATAAPQCHVQSVVALATRALTPLDWPRTVLTADWFQTGNNGNKVIINTAGPSSAQPGGVSLRCNSSGHTTASTCKSYRAGQVAPDTIPTSPPGGTPVLNADQIASLKAQAQSAGTYYSGCPGSVNVAGLALGTVVFVQGGPTCATGASGNTATNPVAFVINDGSFSLGGNSTFYGLVYDINASNSSASLVNLGGCAHIQGMIAVDGLGGVNVGQCKENLVFDPTIMGSLRTYAGAVVAQNSFRVLPANTP